MFDSEFMQKFLSARVLSSTVCLSTISMSACLRKKVKKNPQILYITFNN